MRKLGSALEDEISIFDELAHRGLGRTLSNALAIHANSSVVFDDNDLLLHQPSTLKAICVDLLRP